MDKQEVRISVRRLVEFILRSGDIQPVGLAAHQQMLEGTRIHRKLQREAGADYQAEVRLSCKKTYESFVLVVDGIADGIINTAGGVLIDEIKSVSTPLEQIDSGYNALHWAQAKCYGAIYGREQSLDRLQIRLTYCHVETGQVKHIIQEFTLDELEAFFMDLLDRYAVWGTFSVTHSRERDESIRSLSFPFHEYRRGQRELAGAVYRCVRDKRMLFGQAPTGTGKTISTLFPAIKAMGEQMGEKIFYLTAKTIARQVAEQAVSLMQMQGLILKAVTLTARERICACSVRSCDPEECQRAKGHYDRINDALMDMLKKESLITRPVLEHYAAVHQVCPFEYSLDAASWLDAVICDFNYVFDPRAYLRRFFEQGGDYILLVDEAHNLVDRAREMYSAALEKRAFMEQGRHTRVAAPQLHKALKKVNRYFLELRKGFENNYDTRTLEQPEALYTLVEQTVKAFEQYMGKNRHVPVSNDLLDLFFKCLSFLAVYRLYDERYVTYVTREKDEVLLKLFCVDPSFLLRKACSKGRMAVFFSATLLPMGYFQQMLGGEREDPVLSLPSPFAPEHLCLMTAGSISTRYKDREAGYGEVARYIKAALEPKTGNYLVFFPSFAYMMKVYTCYTEYWPEDRTILQRPSMQDEEREAYLSMFQVNPEHTLAAFAVMGGIFSEGIDLIGDRLSGAVIVGVGLPQLCTERDIISRHFQMGKGDGFAYAYLFPGMNRVLQAAGRVIRTEQDKGFVLLLDDRFLHRRYLSLFPREWEGYARVWSPEEVQRHLEGFW